MQCSVVPRGGGGDDTSLQASIRIRWETTIDYKILYFLSHNEWLYTIVYLPGYERRCCLDPGWTGTGYGDIGMFRSDQ
jgi:hypothetical protein